MVADLVVHGTRDRGQWLRRGKETVPIALLRSCWSVAREEVGLKLQPGHGSIASSSCSSLVEMS